MKTFFRNTKTLVLFGGLTWALFANAATKDEATQRVQIANTQRLDFQTGGTVTFKNSTGELTVEAWDQPAVEITTTKSTKEEYAASERDRATHLLGEVQVKAERKGGDLVITTNFPKKAMPPFSPFGRATNFDLNYLVKVPRDSKLVITHNAGEIHVEEVTGDIQATALQGMIFLHLPEDAKYDIHATSAIGRVKSDFDGSTKRRFPLGDAFLETPSAPHKLDLKIRFGDILIFKTEQPKLPAPTKP